jgi:adenosine 3'-phospho 5'-phosphosulfate transporter B2
MLMGKLVSRQTYEYYEYVTASLISFGMVLFLSGSGDSLKVTESTGASSVGMSGVVVLVLYMVFDSFTSNWQSALFKTYKVSSVRMMAGVNLFACLLTGISLFQQGTLFHSTDFMFQVRTYSKHYLRFTI